MAQKKIEFDSKLSMNLNGNLSIKINSIIPMLRLISHTWYKISLLILDILKINYDKQDY